MVSVAVYASAPVWASDLPAVTDLSPQALAALANPKPMQPKAELKKEVAKAPAPATKTATAKPAPRVIYEEAGSLAPEDSDLESVYLEARH